MKKAIISNGIIVGFANGIPAGPGVYEVENPNSLQLAAGIGYEFELIGEVCRVLMEKDSILAVSHLWRNRYSDYKQAREKIKSLVAAKGGTAGLTDQERRIAAEWFVLSQAEVAAVLTLRDTVTARRRYNEESRKSRQARFELVQDYFDTVLNGDDALKVMQVVVGRNFEHMYVKMGVEGDGATNYKGKKDPANGIIDFIKSQGDFAATGLASLNLLPLYGLAVQDLINTSLSILKNGNYEL